MLEHVRRPELAARLRKAIDDTLNVDGIRTGDLGGTAGTRAFGRAVAARVRGG